MNTTVGFVWKLFPSHIKLFITGYVLFLFFYYHYLLNSVLCAFQDYFSLFETGPSVGGRKRENPEKNTWHTRK